MGRRRGRRVTNTSQETPDSSTSITALDGEVRNENSQKGAACVNTVGPWLSGHQLSGYLYYPAAILTDTGWPNKNGTVDTVDF